MVAIHGITVTLIQQVEAGVNEFNETVYEPREIPVDNVLVAPSSEQEILDTVNIYGRKAVYTLGIPKGDTHDWKNQVVMFFGKRWRTIGEPLEGIEDMIPLAWNRKVRCESLVEE